MLLVVLDGVGIGAAPDAVQYGDAGSSTLGNLARAVGGLDLPNLAAMGLGRCRPLLGMDPGPTPTAAHGVAVPRSPGKDSTTGHWEICGIILERPFPTFPRGFPREVVDAFAARTGRGVLGNVAASGTAIIEDLGKEHQRTGSWIVYTSADSVFQVAAHRETVSVAELYDACRLARGLLVDEVGVSRVIARPFEGAPGAYRRTEGRKDFSLPPPPGTLLDLLAGAGIARVGIGKVGDLFAGRAITGEPAPTNREAYRLLLRAANEVDTGLVFANVIDFDQAWGHRNDAAGFYQGLKDLDAFLPRLLKRLRPDDMLVVTADHGNDPTTGSTDHSREVVPLLVAGPRVVPADLGRRATFADIGATVADYFAVEVLGGGKSFLCQLRA